MHFRVSILNRVLQTLEELEEQFKNFRFKMGLRPLETRDLEQLYGVSLTDDLRHPVVCSNHLLLEGQAISQATCSGYLCLRQVSLCWRLSKET